MVALYGDSQTLNRSMATSFNTIDTNSIFLRTIYARTRINDLIPTQYVLTADGSGGTFWGAVSTISPLGFSEIKDPFGSTVYSTRTSNILQLSTFGVGGLFTPYVDLGTSSLVYSNAYPNVVVARDTVPAVSRAAAAVPPNPENIFYSTGQSTLKLIGVGDLHLSTVTDLRAVFFSISSFTAAGYADLSAEARAWRPYTYSTNSTSAGYATFMSSIPGSAAAAVGSNLPLSTTEAYPNYTTGDVYFSTVSFNMGPFAQYIHPNSTTKMFLELTPNYFLPRMFLGTSSPYTLVKEFSTFVQYESAAGRQILPTASHGTLLTSQNSNVYTSNYFNTPLKLELDTATLQSNYAVDGSNVNYTVYHRIPGAMASLTQDACEILIGPRGGFSNRAPLYDNRTSLQNSVFLSVYNQQGAAPPMPGP